MPNIKITLCNRENSLNMVQLEYDKNTYFEYGFNENRGIKWHDTNLAQFTK